MNTYFISLLLLFNVACYTSYNSDNIPKSTFQKHVIGQWHGGFFSSFLSTLNHLYYCERHNKIPVVYWDRNSHYYDPSGFNGNTNVWEYYFEPVSSLSYQPGDTINNDYAHDVWCHPSADSKLPCFNYLMIEPFKRQLAFQLISKYVKIKPSIQEKIKQFYQQNLERKKTIGIHLRGTDKAKEERLVSPERMIQAAFSHADKDTQFLIASDEQRLFNQMMHLLKGRTVVYYDCYRSDNGQPIHGKKPSKPQLGEDVLIEVLLLSQCNLLVHTLSNVSTAVLYFNPDMANILLR